MEPMTKDQAKKYLIWGYVLAVLGLIIGIVVYMLLTNTMVKKKPLIKFDTFYLIITGLLTSYGFWATYWGVHITSRPILRMTEGIFVFGKGIIDLLLRQVFLRLSIYGIILGSGCIVGILGGGIYKQIKLSLIK